MSELPDDLRSKLRAVYNDELDQADVFAVIRGRKLRFDDKHQHADWLAVFVSELASEDRADGEPQNGRSFGSRSRRRLNSKPISDWDDQPNAGGNVNQPVVRRDNGPDGWQEFIDYHLPTCTHATGRECFGPWHTKDKATRAQIERLMRDQTAEGLT